MKNLLLAIALSLPAASHGAVGLPHVATTTQLAKPYTATYTVFRNGTDLGITTVKFSALGNSRWELTTSTLGTGIAAVIGVEVTERSLLRWNENKPETLDYSFTQKTGWKNKYRNIKVNAQSRQIESQDNQKSYLLKYLPGVLDRHAITIAVMQDLAQGNRGEMAYWVADRDELQNQRYRVTGNQKIDTALGVQNSIRVERIREPANGRSNSLWLATDRHFVPLRIEQKEANGDMIEMRIKTLR